MRIKTNAKTKSPGRPQRVTTLGQLVARLQDHLPDDAAVVAVLQGLVAQGRLRRPALSASQA
ncbi:MAG: hypothetical protein LDL07_13095 [Desulfarculus sp.]|nr:hypothetical protein [Desulfarculus sp.]